MYSNKPFTVISAVVLTIQVLAEAFAAWILFRLDMLPDHIFWILLGVMVLLAVMTGCIMFLRGMWPVSHGRRIVGWVIALFVIAGSLLGGKLAYDAVKTIDQVTAKEPSVQEVFVMVRTDDPARTIEDTAGYAYGIIAEYDVEQTQRVIVSVEELTGTQLNVVSYEKIADTADGLLNDEVDAILMNSAAVALLIEEENYEDFLQKARILRTFRLETLEEELSEPELEATEKPAPESVRNTPFVIYFSGSDTRSNKLRVSRSDVNILAVVNPLTKQILLINTPRDYYVSNPAGRNQKDKLTHCGLYGIENSMKALAGLYGLNVSHYAQINFSGFETLVDAVGGITVYSDQEFDAGHFVHIEKGINNLDGFQALSFARERYNVSGGDRSRGKNQMKVIKAIVEKMTSGTTIISGYSDILASLEGMFQTSVTGKEISLLVKMQLSDMAKWNIQTYAVTGTGGSDRNYSSPGVRSYVMYPDKASVEKATVLANRVIAGETITEEDVK